MNQKNIINQKDSKNNAKKNGYYQEIENSLKQNTKILFQKSRMLGFVSPVIAVVCIFIAVKTCNIQFAIAAFMIFEAAFLLFAIKSMQKILNQIKSQYYKDFVNPLIKEISGTAIFEDNFKDTGFYNEMQRTGVVPFATLVHPAGRLITDNFSMYNYTAKYQGSEGTQKDFVKTFYGQIFDISINNNIKNNICIIEKTDKKNHYFPMFNKVKISLEYEEFNKIYDVYATDEQECLYFLNPAAVEFLLYLHNQNLGRVSIYVTKNKLYISFNTEKTMFSLKTLSWRDYKKCLESFSIEKQHDDVINLFNTVSVLVEKLNDKNILESEVYDMTVGG